MIVAGLLVAGMAMAQQAEIDRYNVEWDTPSENSAGSMPLGNGELGANLWVEKNGDLLFYLSRTDAISEANRLMKMGRVRVSLSPNPFREGLPFSQQLVLKDGAIYVTAGKDGEAVKFSFYMDPDQETAYLQARSYFIVCINDKARFLHRISVVFLIELQKMGMMVKHSIKGIEYG